MKMQYVLSEIPENFNSKGGFRGSFTNQKQLDTKAVVQEALQMNYVPAYSPTQVKACAIGLLESMIAGVSRDGNPRSVDGFFKVTPVLKGRFEKADSSYDAKKNCVVVNVQLLRELKPVDVSNWSFVNATPSAGGTTPPVEPPTATGYEADGMEGEPIAMDGGGVTVRGANLAGATAVRFAYTADGEAFYEMPVTASTDASAEGTAGYSGALTAHSGYLRVVTPNGVSNPLPCTFAE